MRFANVRGRASLLVGDGAVDIAGASSDQFSHDPMLALGRWEELVVWAAATDLPCPTPFESADLGAPVPRPRQVFAVALNYRPHVQEAGYADPEAPLVFTKFPSCITGPYGTIGLPPGHVDWEIELVAVVGREAAHVPAAAAAEVLAGLTVGQDLSERLLQLSGRPAQFSLGKSHPGFGPIGPAVITLDELADPDDLALTCHLDDEQVQASRTGSMIFSVGQLVEHITAVCPVFAGDLIFTGTPGGVGNRRTPPLFIAEGNELVSSIEGLGEMRHRFLRRHPG